MNSKELQETRDIAASKHGGSFHYRAAFCAGWDEAIRHLSLLLQTSGGDGCYCAHHPDDPAHTKDCYDFIPALTGE